MFVFNILVYIFFTYVMYSLGKKSVAFARNPYKIDKELWGYILFFVLICALRGNTGVDTLAYVNIFEQGYYGSVNREYMFFCIADFLSSNSIHFLVGFGICAFVQIIFIVKGLLPYRILLVYFPIILFGSDLFLCMTGIMRQMVSASIFLYATKFIVERRFVSYLLLIIFASLFHYTALMLIFMFFFPVRLDISNLRVQLIIMYVLCVVVGILAPYLLLSNWVHDVLSFAESKQYAWFLDALNDGSYVFETKTFGPMQLSCFLSGFAVIWFGPKVGGKYGEVMPQFKLWYLFAVIYSCLYFLVCNISHLVVRPILYLQLFQTVILSLTIVECARCGRRRIEYRQIVIWLVIIIWTSIIWRVIKYSNLPNEYVTYKLFFV